MEAKRAKVGVIGGDPGWVAELEHGLAHCGINHEVALTTRVGAETWRDGGCLSALVLLASTESSDVAEWLASVVAADADLVVVASAAAIAPPERERVQRLAGVGSVLPEPVEPETVAQRLGWGFERNELLRRIRSLEAQTASDATTLAATMSRAAAELSSRHGELEAATRRLLEAEQLAAVGRVVTGIAHELSQQLALVGYAEALRIRLATDPEGRELAEAMVAAQTRLAAMVDEIRWFATSVPDGPASRRTRLEPADVVAVIDDALGLLAYDPDVRRRRIVRKVQARPLAQLDVQRIVQVVINLVSNAALATQPGDEITVEIDQRDRDAVIRVIDVGVGMPPAVVARLGEPFFSTRGDRGSGLGVGICRRIVEEHGGRLEFDSSPGRGTTATVSLPAIGGGA